MGKVQPRYRALHETGELSRRAGALRTRLRACTLCPRRCGVNRLSGELGFCRTGAGLKIASVTLHPWEEPPIAGAAGSGTVFFSGCTLSCLFCQNFPISQMGVGREMTPGDLARRMVLLQRQGAANINCVTPTHQAAAFVSALDLAAARGLSIPVVWNTGGYEDPEILEILSGVVDIWLPDVKYDDEATARRLSGAPDYVARNREALRLMWRDAGALRVGGDGVATGGVLVRHMVLPGGLAGTRGCLAFLSREFGPGAAVSLMHQYFPAHRAHDMPPLDRKITWEEWEAALLALEEYGIERGFFQEWDEDG